MESPHCILKHSYQYKGALPQLLTTWNIKEEWKQHASVALHKVP